MKHLRLWPALAALAGLTACGGLFKTHEPVPVIYTLRAAPAPAAPAVVDATLLVARPIARPGLDSERMAVLLSNRRLDSYSGAHWSAPVPRVVEGLLVDAFRSTGAWRAVVNDRSAFPGRYLLQTEITEFAADYAESGAAPLVRVALRGELGLVSERRLVANVAGSAEVRAAADRQHDVAAAFEAACDAAIGKLVAAADAAALAAEAARPPQAAQAAP
jgi:cholesterol transport system auxiliary component